METLLRCLADHNTSLHEIRLQATDEEASSILERIDYWLELNRAGRCLVKESLPVPVSGPGPRPLLAEGDHHHEDNGNGDDNYNYNDREVDDHHDDDHDPSAASNLQDGCHGPNRRHRERVPMGLWPTVLEKSNARPDSIFYLVREALSPRISNYRR
mmetsp:Transcript_17792/g.49294  ORF Transcript_17792/g.49294 Transcript_17792/m.49294 type:complete len:157 (+) Transcript_17792:483-953(+)